MASRDLDSAIVLTKGLTVTGRVVDAAGRPVKGAKAIVGTTPRTPALDRDDERTGRVRPGELRRRPDDRHGRRPRASRHELRKVQVAERRPHPWPSRSRSRDAILRGKVVDLDGKPVAGAFFGADTWRGHRSMVPGQHRGDGRFEWRSAPKDVVLYSAGNYGYMSSRNVPMTASDKEQVITLYPELVIAGRVTDAETGRPVTRFRVVRGQKYPVRKQTDWAENEAVEVTGGRYTVRFNEPCEGFFVRVEAPGYQPAESRAFRCDRGEPDLRLRPPPRRRSCPGSSCSPTASRPTGAEVMLATETMGCADAGRGDFDRRANLAEDHDRTRRPVRVHAAEGASSCSSRPATRDMPTPPPRSCRESGKLVLAVVGEDRGRGPDRESARGRPARSTYSPDSGVRGTGPMSSTYGYHAVTDDRGRFAFDRVVPGRGTASRELPARGEGPGMQAWGWQEPVEVKPGQTARVRLGGGGRAVVGRIVLDGKPESPVDWTKNQPVEIHDRLEAAPVRRGSRQGRAVPDRGRPARRVRAESHRDRSARAGVARREADRLCAARDLLVAPGRPDQPVELGVITAKLFETLKVGELAPDFNVERLAGKGKGDRLQLGDERGKLVLLDFWATLVPALRSTKSPPARTSRRPSAATRGSGSSASGATRTSSRPCGAIRENGLIWTHGFAGVRASGVVVNYKLRTIPATFLVGPDGRILAKDLRGAALKEADRQGPEG